MFLCKFSDTFRYVICIFIYIIILYRTPVIFIAGRAKAALLFWFFGDFRCGALLFMVINVIYKYKNR